MQLGHPALEYEEGVHTLRQKVKIVEANVEFDWRGNVSSREAHRFFIERVRFGHGKREKSKERVR